MRAAAIVVLCLGLAIAFGCGGCGGGGKPDAPDGPGPDAEGPVKPGPGPKPAPRPPQPHPGPRPAPRPGPRTLTVYTSAGCAPCARLKAALVADPVLLAELRSRWTLHVLEDPEAARAAGVSAYPTLVAHTPDGELGRKVGYQGGRELANWLRSLGPQEEAGDQP